MDILSSHPLNNALLLYRCCSSGCIFTDALGETICQPSSLVLPLRPQGSRRHNSFPRSPEAVKGPIVHFLRVSEASSLALSLMFDLKVCLTFNPRRCSLNQLHIYFQEGITEERILGRQSVLPGKRPPSRLVSDPSSRSRL